MYTRQGVKKYALPGAGGIGEKRMVKQYMGLEIAPEQRTPPPCTLRRRALYFYLPQRGKDVGNLSAARQKLGFKKSVLNET